MDPPFGGLSLVAHPKTPPKDVQGVFVTYVWKTPGEFKFDFMIEAPPSALKLPSCALSASSGEHWDHTRFDILLLDPSSGDYVEIVFSPSGLWKANRFNGYRSGQSSVTLPQAPQIFTSDLEQSGRALRKHLLDLGLDGDSPLFKAAPLPNLPLPQHFWLSGHCEATDIPSRFNRVAISALAEESDGTKSYWALAHPPDRPDSHAREGFVLELPTTVDPAVSRGCSTGSQN